MEKWFLSSNGSGVLSLTIKGLLTSLAPLIIMVASFMGYKLGSDQVDTFIVAVTGFVSSAMILFGLLRKIYYMLKSKPSKPTDNQDVTDSIINGQ